jgi:OOP family OmpA-OmpF porin
MSIRTLAVCLMLTAPFAMSQASAQTSAKAKTYPNGRGGEVTLPMGDLSFADEIVSFTPGDPAAKPDHAIAQKAIAVPDFKSGVDDNYVTLGCGGELVLRFVDNALTDVAGPDLYIFETANNVEQADVFISKDGAEWAKVGVIEGATTALDIKERATARDTYSYVKIADRKSSCTASTTGADIDAVAAIGSARRASFDSAVLFDLGKSVLKPGAATALKGLADEIQSYEKVRVILEGHTDASGSDVINTDLSRRRADAVRAYLASNGVPKAIIDTVGYGELQPVAPNDTAANMAKNRRVEALVIVG